MILSGLLYGCSDNAAVSSPAVTYTQPARTITDMAGRTVEIPEDIKKVYSTGQPGVVMLYTLCPEKLLGWCLELGDEAKEYIDAQYLSLPVLGLMQGSNDTANKEEIMGREPDIIILVTEIDEDAIETADDIQDKMCIPVVVLDYSLESLYKSYKFLGEIVGEEQRAEALGTYCDETIKNAKTIAATIPESEAVSVYYAQGSKGLQTAPAGSSHSEVIDLVGGKNVVTLEAESDGRLGVNMEQVLLWNPDVIIASYSMDHTQADNEDDGFSTIINSADTWKQINAVKNDMVFSVPNYPFNWLDMPPSANRIIGIKWMGELLYPDFYDYDLKKETREFYSLFYNKELTDEQLDTLLKEYAD